MQDPKHHPGDTSANGDSLKQEATPLASMKSPSLKPGQDRASDNEDSEPVREKLKKTSLASMPRQNGSTAEAESDNAEMRSKTPEGLEESPQAGGEHPETEQKDRGRPTRKRSFEDLEDADKEKAIDEVEQGSSTTPGRARKRSKDVRTSTSPQTREYEDTNMMNEGEKTNEKVSGLDAHPEPRNVGNDTNQRLVDTDLADEDMLSTFSPRKKRSRDQMEAEAQREQKIPATEEAKAHRRSEEQERDQRISDDNMASANGGTNANTTNTEATQPVKPTAGEVCLLSEYANPGFTDTSPGL